MHLLLQFENSCDIITKSAEIKPQGCSSVGRTAVSKTACPEFESLRPCQEKTSSEDEVFSTKFALRASEMYLRYVKYAGACEIFAARKWANFISLCGLPQNFTFADTVGKYFTSRVSEIFHLYISFPKSIFFCVLLLPLYTTPRISPRRLIKQPRYHPS